MKLATILMASLLVLGACGTSTPDRATSGAAIGAGTGAMIGVIGGPVGILGGALIGGAVGAGTGTVTDPNKVNLGEPVYHFDDHNNKATIHRQHK